MSEFVWIIFRTLEIYFDKIKYEYTDNNWIAAVINKMGESQTNIAIQIHVPDNRTLKCIRLITSELKRHENVVKLDFLVNEKESVGDLHCSAFIELMKQMINLRTVIIQSREEMSDIYKYIILGGNITDLYILHTSGDPEYIYNNGIKVISETFKLVGQKYIHDIDDSIKYALKFRQPPISLPSVIYNNKIRRLCVNGAKLVELKMILDSYPSLEEFELEITHFFQLNTLLSENKTMCPNLRTVHLTWGTCSLVMMKTIVKWSRNNDHMKTLTFHRVEFQLGALEYLLDDINSAEGNRTHIEEFVTTRCISDVIQDQQNTIKRILKDRKTAVALVWINEKNGEMGWTQSTIQKIMLKILHT
jgi:hypothetical protein